MPRKTPTPTAALSLPEGLKFSPQRANERTASVVAANPRLLAVVPADELRQLTTAWEGATKAKAAALALPVEADDVVSDLTRRFRAGEEVAPADVLDRIATAQAAQDRRDRTVQLLAGLPEKFATEIARLLDACLLDYYEALGEELDAILDAAEDTVSELGSISSADEAIEAKKADAWAALKDHAKAYAEVREIQLRLIRLDDSKNFHPTSPTVAYAFFRSLEKVAPDFASVMRQKPTDLRGRPVQAASFDVLDFASVGHFLAVARHRAALNPAVVDGDEALALQAEAAGRIVDTGVPMERSRAITRHGGEEGALRAAYGTRASGLRADVVSE
jgi:hypothetical protein